MRTASTGRCDRLMTWPDIAEDDGAGQTVAHFIDVGIEWTHAVNRPSLAGHIFCNSVEFEAVVSAVLACRQTSRPEPEPVFR
jgi:hypothetical protein